MTDGSFFALPLCLVHNPPEASFSSSFLAPLSSLKPNVFSPVFWSTWADWIKQMGWCLCPSMYFFLRSETSPSASCWPGKLVLVLQSLGPHSLGSSSSLICSPLFFLAQHYTPTTCSFSILSTDYIQSSVFWQVVSSLRLGAVRSFLNLKFQKQYLALLVDVKNHLQDKGKKSGISIN